MGGVAAGRSTHSIGGLSALCRARMASRCCAQHIGVFHDPRKDLWCVVRALFGPDGLSRCGRGLHSIPRRARNCASIAHSVEVGVPQGVMTSSGMSKSMRTSQHKVSRSLELGLCASCAIRISMRRARPSSQYARSCSGS